MSIAGASAARGRPQRVICRERREAGITAFPSPPGRQADLDRPATALPEGGFLALAGKPFKDEIPNNFNSLQVPVITLAQNTTKEAVCLVFEKVNTGGKALDAFELVTAMYAAHNFELWKDWFARQAAMSQQKVLRNVASTEFLQAVALLNTKALRDDHLTSHLIDPALLRANDFPAFIAAREKALLKLIEQATGRSAYRGDADEPEQEVDPSPDIDQTQMAAE